jgi:hypothetical protein
VFDLRKKYKQEKNQIQETVKLLMNSIYGKSILKAIPTKTVVKRRGVEFDRYLVRQYNYMTKISYREGSDKCFIQVIKPINTHWNLPQFGVSVLSWSKYLMNRVMCLAERNGIQIFYQDTDSMHILDGMVPTLEKLYMASFGKKLIGEDLGQFHCDFSFDGAVGKPHSVLFIGVGKKSYLDVLEDDAGNRDYHIRLKGIPNACIHKWCQRHRCSLEDLYFKLFDGKSVRFNLKDGAACFKKTEYYSQITRAEFFRRVSFK